MANKTEQQYQNRLWVSRIISPFLGDSRRAWKLLAIINPVNHGRSPEEIETYKVAPSVVTADVYAVSPHSGRGGWTWYTGSTGWMYRFIVESLLGLRLEADKLRFEPCLPEDWEMFKVHYRYRETIYHITVRQTPSANNKMISETSVTIDGVKQHDNTIPLVDDRQEHSVEVWIHVAGFFITQIPKLPGTAEPEGA